MDNILHFVQQMPFLPLLHKILYIILILIAAWIGSKILGNLLNRLNSILIKRSLSSGESVTESSKRIETLMRLLRQAVSLVLWIMVFLMIVKEIGIDIGPVLAGAGIMGLAIGFGAQSLVKDVISGFFLIMENQVRVGDVVSINEISGLVEQINFRTIVLRDLAGVVHIIPNGSISSLSNMTYEWSAYVFDIGISYREDINKVIDILKETGAKMRQESPYKDYIIDDPETFGVDKFDESAVVIKGRIRTKPIRQWDVGREFLKRVKYAFDRQGIEIPFPQRVVSFSDKSILKMIETKQLQ